MEGVLYYSDKCKYSKKLFELLKQEEKIISSIKVVNIDREPFPRNIKCVPTLLLKNVGELVGKGLFQYVESKMIQSYEFKSNENESFSYLGTDGYAETMQNYTNLS
jgi:hypothetical protein